MSDPAEMRLFDLGLAKGIEIERERMAAIIESDIESLVEAGWEDEDVVTTDFRSLKQGMREAAQAEQDRIIKVLEEHTYYGQDGCLEFSDKALTRSDLEALIKANK